MRPKEVQEAVVPSQYLHAFSTAMDSCIQMVELEGERLVVVAFPRAIVSMGVVVQEVILGTFHHTQYEEMSFATDSSKVVEGEEKTAKYVP